MAKCIGHDVYFTRPTRATPGERFSQTGLPAIYNKHVELEPVREIWHMPNKFERRQLYPSRVLYRGSVLFWTCYKVLDNPD